MLPAMVTLAASGLLLGAAPDDAYGYLYTTTADGDCVRTTAEPYVPHEGDVIFYDDHNKIWTVLFWMGGTTPPFHVGIVVKRPDGAPAVLEAGAYDQTWVWVLDLPERLKGFDGTIQIRPCKVDLTPQQSERLTMFALAQHNKRYALLRLALQLTPVRSRGYLHNRFYATTYLDRQRWVCAEIVVTAGTLVGLFDPAVVKATAAYPLDLLDDRKYDLSAVFDKPHCWSPRPRRGGGG